MRCCINIRSGESNGEPFDHDTVADKAQVRFCSYCDTILSYANLETGATKGNLDEDPFIPRSLCDVLNLTR